MKLPEYVNNCVRALEQAGFTAYAVGGCVRDDLLGRQPGDYDLCTDALPEQLQKVFAHYPLDLTGAAHGTVRVRTEADTVEITTFRRDGTYQDNRRPDRVEFVPDIRTDLARRDFTVNAIAWSERTGFVDPFGGIADLRAGLLRTVGDPFTRFREDSLRILRGMRFAARFRLELEPETRRAMLELAPLTDNLSRERVFEELSGFLTAAGLEDLLRFASLLGVLIPELAPLPGFDQHSPHHAYDLYTHVAHVTAGMPGELPLRWAALLHDIGKIPTFTQDKNGRGHFYGHAQTGAVMAEAALQRLKAPRELREEAVWLIENHMARLQPDRKQLHPLLARYGFDALRRLLLLQEADMNSKGTDEHLGNDSFRRVRLLLDQLEAEGICLNLKTLNITSAELMALGYTNRELGRCLNGLLKAVVEEALPNDHDALLRAAQEMVNGEG